jgi:hypothetical protein
MRIDPVDDQTCNAMGEGLRFPRPGARNDKSGGASVAGSGVTPFLTARRCSSFKSVKYSWHIYCVLAVYPIWSANNH